MDADPSGRKGLMLFYSFTGEENTSWLPGYLMVQMSGASVVAVPQGGSVMEGGR